MAKATIEANFNKTIWFVCPAIAVDFQDKQMFIAWVCFSITISI